jgi:predicted ABC-type ATPase
MKHSALINHAINSVLKNSSKPLAIILAGHNGAGKSTLWYSHVANEFKIPLINADRMLMSVLPDRNAAGALPDWAQNLRDGNEAWSKVAQEGVNGFVGAAMGQLVPFAFETVFSYWVEQSDGSIRSKIDTIRELQQSGYFVLLLFVGLTNVGLSIGRVETRSLQGGHAVPFGRLVDRFPRTRKAIGAALNVADATILFDNSRSERLAFTPVQVRQKRKVQYDIRRAMPRTPMLIREWLDVIAPLDGRSVG